MMAGTSKTPSFFGCWFSGDRTGLIRSFLWFDCVVFAGVLVKKYEFDGLMDQFVS